MLKIYRFFRCGSEDSNEIVGILSIEYLQFHCYFQNHIKNQEIFKIPKKYFFTPWKIYFCN